MRWIKFKVPMAGNHGQSWQLGDVVEWDAADAERLVKAGYAEWAKPPAKDK